MYMSKIKAAVFDVDGMLLDSREYIYSAFEATLVKHGYPKPTRPQIAKTGGRSLADGYRAFAPEDDLPALMQSHRAFQENRRHLIKPYDGLHEMLKSLSDAGLLLAVLSSRYGNLVPSLKAASIDKYFDVIVHGEAVERHKPHPEGLIKALKELGVKPTESAMLGDTDVDILTGKAANVAITVGITHGFHTRKVLNKAKPDYIVDSLSEIPKILLG
jgi:pyrophosphatase PpaX